MDRLADRWTFAIVELLSQLKIQINTQKILVKFQIIWSIQGCVTAPLLVEFAHFFYLYSKTPIFL